MDQSRPRLLKGVCFFVGISFGFLALASCERTPEEIAAQAAREAAAEATREAEQTKQHLRNYARTVCTTLFDDAAPYSLDTTDLWISLDPMSDVRLRVMIEGAKGNGYGAGVAMLAVCDVFEDGDVIDFALRKERGANHVRPYSREKLQSLSAVWWAEYFEAD